MTKSEALYLHAKQRIPGGVQLLSKRPEMFAPGQWPNYAAKAKGCELWDLDGNRYYDMTTNGIGACMDELRLLHHAPHQGASRRQHQCDQRAG